MCSITRPPSYWNVLLFIYLTIFCFILLLKLQVYFGSSFICIVLFFNRKAALEKHRNSGYEFINAS